jgi:hypothetical protein
VTYEGVRLTVLAMDGHRVDRVRVVRGGDAGEDAPEEAPPEQHRADGPGGPS